MSFARTALVVLVVLLVVGLPALACSAGKPQVSSTADVSLAPRYQVGLAEDLEYLSGPALRARLDAFAALGLRWARFQMIWGTVQAGGPHAYDWAPYDAVISGLVARGIRPLVVIDTSPPWDRVGGCGAGLTCAPADPAGYASFAAAAVARYAPRGVHDWEIWNEPNNAAFWAPAPNVQAYTILLKGAYTAIKAVDPTATVISGGLAPAITSSGAGLPQIAPLAFLAGVYAAGGHGYFDAVGWHPYTYPAMPGLVDPLSAWYQMYEPSIGVRSLMLSHGDGAKRIWATEFGAPTDAGVAQSVTPTVQAEMFVRAMALWSSYPWAGPFIGYQYQDRGTDREDIQEFFGLFGVDGSPKPAFLSFKRSVALLERLGRARRAGGSQPAPASGLTIGA